MGQWLDEVARALASGSDRRAALRRIGGAALGLVAGGLLPRQVQAQTTCGGAVRCGTTTVSCCDPAVARCCNQDGPTGRCCAQSAACCVSGDRRVVACCTAAQVCSRTQTYAACRSCASGTVRCPNGLVCCPTTGQCPTGAGTTCQSAPTCVNPGGTCPGAGGQPCCNGLPCINEVCGCTGNFGDPNAVRPCPQDAPLCNDGTCRPTNGACGGLGQACCLDGPACAGSATCINNVCGCTANFGANGDRPCPQATPLCTAATGACHACAQGTLCPTSGGASAICCTTACVGSAAAPACCSGPCCPAAAAQLDTSDIIVANDVSGGLLIDGVEVAQFNFCSIICPILQAILNSFSGSPFFAFIAAILQALLASFGCVLAAADREAVARASANREGSTPMVPEEIRPELCPQLFEIVDASRGTEEGRQAEALILAAGCVPPETDAS